MNKNYYYLVALILIILMVFADLFYQVRESTHPELNYGDPTHETR